MVVLITGGRDYENKDQLFAVLDALHQQSPVELLIHGGADGADTLGANWAFKNEINCMRVPAKWKMHGNSAGPIRNREMLGLKYTPDVCLAFPTTGPGTRDMIREAEKHMEVKVYESNQAQ